MGSEREENKGRPTGQSMKVFPIGGFFIGFLFLIAFYVMAFLQIPDVFSGKTVWEAVQ